MRKTDYIVEDIFRDINPDDLMNDNDDDYRSPSISIKRSADNNYEWSFCIETDDYNKIRMIEDLNDILSTNDFLYFSDIYLTKCHMINAVNTSEPDNLEYDKEDLMYDPENTEEYGVNSSKAKISRNFYKNMYC